MITRSEDGKQRVLSLSYGKDSMACLGAIERLGLPLDRIITADVWATDAIPADLPPMVDFKATADKIIKERYGIGVEHYRAISYEHQFYKRRFNKKKKIYCIYGFPIVRGPWCNSMIKMAALDKAKKSCSHSCISYVGIAADETERLKRLDGVTKISPLHLIGWTEADTRKWCEENDLLSPIYASTARGGCWFCHNQGVGQLRLLRKNYPELWALLLKWDNDSPVTFHSDGRTVHDYDRRFRWEDDCFLPSGKRFRWADIEQPQMNMSQICRNGDANEC